LNFKVNVETFKIAPKSKIYEAFQEDMQIPYLDLGDLFEKVIFVSDFLNLDSETNPMLIFVI
jgi:hypothetical protein